MNAVSPLTRSETRSIRLVYFAWVRERVGLPEETLDIPADLATVTDLVRWLKSRGENSPRRCRAEGGDENPDRSAHDDAREKLNHRRGTRVRGGPAGRSGRGRARSARPGRHHPSQTEA